MTKKLTEQLNKLWGTSEIDSFYFYYVIVQSQLLYSNSLNISLVWLVFKMAQNLWDC